jgi:lysocardiolipin and lysophospholipid acyltransferase
MAVPRPLRGAVGGLLIAVGVAAVACLGLGPALPLLVLAPGVYRRYTSWAAGMLFTYVAAIMELVFGTAVVHYGDPMPLSDGAAVLSSNHRTRLDWAMLYPLLARWGRLSTLHIVLKAGVRPMPYMGWVVQMIRYVFLERHWESDADHLARMLTYIADGGSNTTPRTHCVLLFPEGTDLSEKNKARSHAFAAKHGLATYHHVLHPRTKGFAACVAALRAARNRLQTVYDVTIAYTGSVPQKEAQLLTGRMPSATHALVRTYPAASLPGDEAGLEAWMVARFAEKEMLLADFYGDGGKRLRPELVPGCPPSAVQGHRLPVPWLTYATAVGFVALLLAGAAKAATLAPMLFWAYLAVYHVAFVVVLPRVWGGADKLELQLHGGSGDPGAAGGRRRE